VSGALLALPFGLAIGVLLGMLGGGGSILAVPVLVYVLGQPVHEATTTSLLVVGAAALGGAVDQGRAGRVRWRTAVGFGAAGAVGAVGGSALNHAVGGRFLLLAFAALLLVVAALMFRADSPLLLMRSLRRRELRVLVAGVATGVLTGFFGVGGGFIIVPVLVLVLGFAMREAVGTSLAVISITSAVALAAHLAGGTIDWYVACGFTAAALVGVVAGGRAAGRLSPAVLRIGFGVLLVAVAVALVAANAL
jgi:uncharacterized protein